MLGSLNAATLLSAGCQASNTARIHIYACTATIGVGRGIRVGKTPDRDFAFDLGEAPSLGCAALNARR